MQTNGFIEPDLLVLKVLFSDNTSEDTNSGSFVTALTDEDNELRLHFLGFQTLYVLISNSLSLALSASILHSMRFIFWAVLHLSRNNGGL